MPLSDVDHETVYAYLRGLEAGVSRAAPSGVSQGAIGYAAGGPTWLDAYHSKRPPTPVELVNAYKAIAYACIGLNAKGVARVPLRLYATTGAGQRAVRSYYRPRPVPDGRQRYLRSRPELARTLGHADDVTEITHHPLLDALETPNPFFDKLTMFTYMVICLDAVGSAFLAPEGRTGPDGTLDPTWAPQQIWPIQPQYVFPVKGAGDELLRGWRYFGDEFAPHELVRVRHVSLRDPYLSAYAPLHACYEQVGLVDYYTASIEGILKGGAMPAGIVSAKEGYPIGDVEADRLEAQLNQKQTGPYKGRWWVARQNIDVHPLTFAPTDLGGLELTKEQRLLVANAFDVPISLLQTEDSNRATARESTHQHQYYAIAPRCGAIESALTQQLARPIDDRLFFAFDNPVDRDRELDAKVFDLSIRNNSRTINEARAEDNLPPVEWGDEPFAPTPAQQAEAKAAEAKIKAQSSPVVKTDDRADALYRRFHEVLDTIEAGRRFA